MLDFALWVIAVWLSCSVLSILTLMFGHLAIKNGKHSSATILEWCFVAPICMLLGPVALITILRIWDRARRGL